VPYSAGLAPKGSCAILSIFKRKFDYNVIAGRYATPNAVRSSVAVRDDVIDADNLIDVVIVLRHNFYI